MYDSRIIIFTEGMDRQDEIISKLIEEKISNIVISKEIPEIKNEILKCISNEEMIEDEWREQNHINQYLKDNSSVKILIDEIYLGKTINHKRESNIVGSKNNVAVSKEEWITVSSTHEAIISEKDFKEAQKVMNKYKKERNVSQ